METASGTAGGGPYVLLKSGGALGRLALERPDLRALGTEVVRDLSALDDAAAFFASVPDWRAAYEADPIGVWQRADGALQALYQQIHKLTRESLKAFLGNAWLQGVRGSAAYGWYAASAEAAPAATDDGARELAWLDRLCVIRNRTVQHRVGGTAEQAGYTVEPNCFAAVFRTPETDDLEGLRGAMDDARAAYPSIGIEAVASPETAAYLTSIAEQLHDLDPPRADAIRRTVIRSGVLPLVGSIALAEHLDLAISRVVGARFDEAAA